MTRLSLNDLLPNTTYAIRLRAVGVNSVSEWSTRHLFTTTSDTISPSVPTGVTWASTGDSFHGEWTPVVDNLNGDPIEVTRYEVELVSGGVTKVDSLAASTGSKVIYDLSLEANRALFGTPAGTIAMRVRAVDNKNLKSGWSATITASNPRPANVTNLSGTVGVDQITLKWDAVADTDIARYEVYVGSTAGFTPAASNRVFSGMATTFSYTTATYAAHYFKVRAVDKFEQTSVTDTTSAALTPVNPFIVDSTPPAVPSALAATITNNPNGQGAKASVSWTLGSETDRSYVELSYKRNADSVWTSVLLGKDQTSAIVDLASAYTAYDFRIRAADASANTSAFSTTLNKAAVAATIPATPTGFTASPGKDSIVYRWSRNTETDIKNYELVFSTTSGFTGGTTTTFYTGTANTVTVSGLNPNTNYWATVRATNQADLSSTATAVLASGTTSFPTTPLSDGAAPASSPTPTVTPGLGYLYLTWTPVTNNDAVTYEVHMSTTSGFTPAAGTKAAEVSGTFALLDVLPGTSTPLAYGTTYYVKLIAKDRDGAAAAGAQGSGSPVKVGSGDSTLTPGDIGAPTNLEFSNLGGRVDTSVKTYSTEYYLSTSESTPTGGTWSTSSPTRTPGSFIWTRTVVTYQNNNTATTNPALLTGNTGAQGSPGPVGRGITSTTVTYQVTSNGTVAPGSTGWSASIPATSPGQFLWTRTVLNYSDATSDTAYSVSAHGATGGQGNAGRGISGTVVNYAVSTDGVNPPGSGWGASIVATSPGQFLWTRTVTSYTDATPATTAYSVAAHGTPGSDGDDGVGIASTTVNYAVHTNGTTAPTSGWSATVPATTTGQFLWTRTVTNYTDGGNNSATPAYSVSAHGATGNNGNDGRGIASTVVEYTKSTSATTIPGSGWSTSIVATTTGEFLWSRTVITYTSGSPATTTTYAVSAHGASGSNGAPASTVDLTATTQALTVAATGGASTPTTAVITGTAANTTIADANSLTSGWSYSVDGAAWSATVPTGVSRSTNTVTITGSTMTAKTIAVKAIGVSGVADTLTVAKVANGAAGSNGVDGYTVLLSNEAHVFPGTQTTAVNGSTVATNIIAYKGATQIVTTTAVSGSLPTGLSVAFTNPGTTNNIATFTASSSLTQQSGTVTLVVTADGKTFNQVFSWSVSYVGAPGSAGGPGPQGTSVNSITPYFQQLTAGASTPATPTANPPGGSWTTTEPTWVNNTDVFRTEQIAYSNGTYAYTVPQRVSGYNAVNGLKNLWGHPADTTFIDGGDIYSNSVATQSISVGDFTNYIADSDLRDPNFDRGGNWFTAGLTRVAPTGTTPGYISWLTNNPVGGNAHRYNNYQFETRHNDSFYFECEVSAPATNTAPVNIIGGIITYTASGGVVTFPQLSPMSVTPGQNWTTYSGIITVQGLDTVYGRFDPFANSTAVSQEIRMRKMVLRKRNTGVLLVDGSIGAREMAADVFKGKVFSVGTGGFIQSELYSSSQGFRIGTSGIELNDANSSVKVDTLKAGTLGGPTGAGVINIAVGTSLIFNGGYLKSNTNTGTTMATAEASNTGFYLGNDGLFIGGGANGGRVKANALISDTLTSTIITLGNGGAINFTGTGQITATGFILNSAGLTLSGGASITGAASIAGEAIKTGEIKSQTTATVNGVTQPVWSINTGGYARFTGMSVLGTTVLGNGPTDTASILQSSNYRPGEIGWMMRGDGWAEFRSVVSGSLNGSAIAGDTLSISSLSGGSLSKVITLAEGSSIVSRGAMGEKVVFSNLGFAVKGPQETKLTFKARDSAGIATLTTGYAHNFAAGFKINVALNESLGDKTFDGSYTVLDTPSATTFRYQQTTTTVVSNTATAGNVKGYNFARPDGPTYIDFPSNGDSPNIISGELTATTLVVTEGVSIRKGSTIESGASLTINNTIQPPTSAPNVAHGYSDFDIIPADTSINEVTAFSNAAGGLYLVGGRTGSKQIIEERNSSGVKIRDVLSIDRTGVVSSIMYTPNYSGKYYVSSTNVVNGQTINTVYVYNSSWVEQSAYSMNTGPYSGTIIPFAVGWNYTNGVPMFAYKPNTGGALWVGNFVVDASGNISGTTGTMSVTSATINMNGVAFIGRGDFDFGTSTDRIVTRASIYGSQTGVPSQYYVMSNAGAGITAANWPVADNANIVGGYWNGSKFIDATATGIVRTYEGGDSYWSSNAMTDRRWVRYSWFKSGTGATTLGPASSWMLPKRARLSATVAPIPYSALSANPTPDQAKVYVLDSDSDAFPTLTNYRLRDTITQPSILADVDPSVIGSADAVSTNAFVTVVGTPGGIYSSSGQSYWKGDDTAQFKQLKIVEGRSSTDAGSYAIITGDANGAILEAWKVTGTVPSQTTARGGLEIKSDYTIMNVVGGSVKIDSTTNIQGKIASAGSAVVLKANHVVIAQPGYAASASTAGNTQALHALDIHSFGGGIWLEDLTQASGTTATINGVGRIVRTGSSIEYKKYVQPMDLDTAKLALAMQAVTFKWKSSMEMGDDRVPGFIAEQADSVGADLWVTKRDDGSAQGIRYAELTAAHNVLVKDLYEENETLKNEVSELSGRLAELESLVNSMVNLTN